ncbi:MAG: hypothetical protein AB1705_00425 [Verrucomicrobiota bacterium]
MRSLFPAMVAVSLFAVSCTRPVMPVSERWVYCSQNLEVDQNIDDLETMFRRAAQAGYTHVLLADPAFARLGEMDEHYFRNVERVKTIAAGLDLEIVPALFAIGHSNVLLWHDPNLIEALPVRDARFVVRGGEARLEADPPVSLKGGDFADLRQWDWKDATVTAEAGAALIRNPKGEHARLVQRIRLAPFRQYHISVRIKTENFRGTPDIQVIAGNRVLSFNQLGAQPTQDWTTHHTVFNSLNHKEANLYLGAWDGQTGSLWLDDARLEEVGLLNLVRREGTPLVVKSEDGRALAEGRDFEKISDPRMGTSPWKGAYDVWHEPPVIKTGLPDGTCLRVSYYHAATIHAGQATICPSEPRTLELLRDQARRMHAAWNAKGYLMSHDEIRVLNWCAACQRRDLDAGELLADNARACISILREVNPGGRIYVWGDMFDPNHNARKNYYLVRGDLSGSWKGLDKDVVILPWYFEKRAQSLRWFARRGHQQVIAGYYDRDPEIIRQWLEATRRIGGVSGVMYTTWQKKYDDLERFAELVPAEPLKR